MNNEVVWLVAPLMELGCGVEIKRLVLPVEFVSPSTIKLGLSLRYL